MRIIIFLQVFRVKHPQKIFKTSVWGVPCTFQGSSRPGWRKLEIVRVPKRADAHQKHETKTQPVGGFNFNPFEQQQYMLVNLHHFPK